MKRICIFFILLITCTSSFGQYGFNYPKISDDVIYRIKILYISGDYKSCIDSCNHYLGYQYNFLTEKSHPYKYWNNSYFYKNINDIDNILWLCYFGCSSAYYYSLSTYDPQSIVLGINWAEISASILVDYLKENSSALFSAEAVSKYILYGTMGVECSLWGEHLTSASGDKHWRNKLQNRLMKTSDRIINLLTKNLSGKEAVMANYPLLRYQVYTLNSIQIFKNGKHNEFKTVIKKRIDSYKQALQQVSSFETTSEFFYHLASLKNILCYPVIENKIVKKIGEDAVRFCLEELIKLQDLSYSLNGSSRYSAYPTYTLRDIQDCLGEEDCAIMHFEAPVQSGRLYFLEDLGSKYRNYAFVITKHQDIPEIWHRGYVSDSVVNNLSQIKKQYPQAKRFYYVGTPRMSFIDIAGNDSSIVRLHSLSQLLQKQNSNTEESELTFIGDLNYKRTGYVDPVISEKKGGNNFRQLIGPAKELEYIKTLFPNVRSICGDDATRNMVTSEISRSNGIVHISTHGELFSPSDDFTPDELILKKNIMENSCVILSGYNDTPRSSLCYMSGSDVLKIKHINTEVVFLDACMSGKGAVGVSGSVGIAEAFHLIGAKNVICYLEPVDDIVATEFSNRFYLELSKGASCHDAFFRAKKSINPNLKVVLWE